MQPRRPDSAKSRITQKTLDTQLNQSKFSQTFTSYTTFQLQKKDEFLKYLEQKQKDPKFKKFNQAPLPQIPQKAPKQQLSKINSKPFQKRTSKAQSKPKIQQANKQQPKQINNSNKINLQQSNSKWTVNQPQNGVKKENKVEFNSSKSFAQKNKQKMNSITAGLKKIQNDQKKVDKKIQLKGFKVNVPGKKDVKNNQQPKQIQNNQFINQDIKQKTNKQSQTNNKQPSNRPQTRSNKINKPQKTQQQLKRQQQLLQISRFINQVQTKNIDYYPDGYEQFVQMNQSRVVQDLQKININDFLIEPTQKDYNKMQRKIRQNQKLLDQQSMTQSRISAMKQSRMSINSNTQSINPSTDQTSIDLDKIIDGDSQIQRNQQNQIFLSSISSKDLRQRNLFLTQVLKGRVTKQDIQKLQQMDKSQLKLRKLEQPVKEQEDDIEIMEINMMKKKSNRLFQRNMVQASGQIYRDCDYLSEQNKLRLQRLLNGQMEPSPFQISEWERFAIRRIDQGIRLYRQLSNSSSNMNMQVIPQQLLPKDPNLRKQAQRKILKQKIQSINSRLQQIQNIVVNQTKIQAIIQEHRTTKISQTTQNLINQRQSQIKEIQQKSKLAIQLISKAQKQKQQIQQVLRQMQVQYKRYQKQCKQYQKLTIQQIVNKQKQDIKQKKKLIMEIQKSLEQIQLGTEQTMNKFNRQMENQIQILRDIQNLSIVSNMHYDGLNQNQTVQNLDAKFQKRANQDPAVLQLRNKMYQEQQKQNQQTI